MSYRDPQRVIDDRYQRIAAGMKGFFDTAGKSIEAYHKKKKKDEKKARKKLDKRMSPFVDDEKEFIEEANSYSSDFETDEQKSNYQNMVRENLEIVRNQ